MHGVQFFQMYVKWDLKDMDITWEEAEELTEDRAGRRQRVDQCNQLEAMRDEPKHQDTKILDILQF